MARPRSRTPAERRRSPETGRDGSLRRSNGPAPHPRGLVVKRQQVISVTTKSGHGCESSDALVWAMPVVVMGPALEHGGTLGGATIGNAIGPFPECRLNEAFGFAIGLRPIGTGEAVLDAQLATRIGERLGAKCRPIVGQHTADGDAESGKVGSAG